MFSTIYRIQIFLRTRPTVPHCLLGISRMQSIVRNLSNIWANQDFARQNGNVGIALENCQTDQGKGPSPNGPLIRKVSALQWIKCCRYLTSNILLLSPLLQILLLLPASISRENFFFRCWINLCRFARTKQQIFDREM